MRIQKNKNSVKVKLIILALILGSILILFVLHRTKSNDTSNNPSMDIGPATEQEKKQTEDYKKELEKKQNQESNDNTDTSKDDDTVNVTITSANQTSISSYVTGAFEDGGTCTATLTQGNSSFSKSSSGFQNVSYTQCAPISMSDSDFPTPGEWAVTVKYSSNNFEGISKVTVIEVVK